MQRTAIWFTQGFSNLYNALSDLRNSDTAGEFTLLCSHTHPQFVGAEAADVRLVEPANCSDARFLAFVEATVLEHNVKVIVPTQKQAFFNKHKSRLAALGAWVATTADTPTLKLINNKGRLYEHLQGKGLVNVPAFTCVKSLGQFNAAYKALAPGHARICIKPTVGVYGSGFRVLKESKDSLGDMLNESLTMSVGALRKRLNTAPGSELLVMQYLEGDERSVDCLAFKGKLIGGVIRRKSDSSVAPQVIEANPALLEQVRELVEHLGLQGLFNVQFKDSGGTPFLLEINTRLSGRSYYATLAGLNLPYLAAQLFSGKKRPEELDIRIETGFLVGNVSTAVRLKTEALRMPFDGVQSGEFPRESH